MTSAHTSNVGLAHLNATWDLRSSLAWHPQANFPLGTYPVTTKLCPLMLSFSLFQVTRLVFEFFYVQHNKHGLNQGK